jgi:hypothetical protein
MSGIKENQTLHSFPFTGKLAILGTCDPKPRIPRPLDVLNSLLTVLVPDLLTVVRGLFEGFL